MQINWPAAAFFFICSIPGILLVIPKLMRLLLKDNSELLQKKIGRFAIAHTLFMAFIMSIAGVSLAKFTGLQSFFLIHFSSDKTLFSPILEMLLPVFLYTALGTVIFLFLYYKLLSPFWDQKTQHILRSFRKTLGWESSILYGITEEILARWGLLSAMVFLGLVLGGGKTPLLMIASIILSSFLYSLTQLPVYLAAGCTPSRSFIYSLIALYLWQGIIFGFVFWQYGIEAGIIAHMGLILLWNLYDPFSAS